MIKWEQWMKIKDLRSQGHSIRAIARMTGASRNTIRKVLKQSAPAAFEKPERNSKLDEFKDYIKNRYEECALSAVRLIEEIQPMGYSGSIQTLRRYVQTLSNRNRALGRATIRFETPPGHQSQADWAYAGRFADAVGEFIKIYIFVMVLSFSRMMFVKFTTSMKLPELIFCHKEAFRYFNGWSASILYDNMKQVRVGPEQWNQQFLDFANYYGIIPKTHRIRRPRTKGKVERMVHYVKDNFLNGRSFADLDDLNLQAMNWLNETANSRIHATTGIPPIELFVKEKLIAYDSIAPYRFVPEHERVVDAESFVRFNRSRYSVPPTSIGKKVIVQHDQQRIVIRCGELIIAEHLAADRPCSCIADPLHMAEVWKISMNRSVPPSGKWKVTFDQKVATPSLAVYEEVDQ